jgi:tripartite-type tricarboxylate transporter receptor subunit TctC
MQTLSRIACATAFAALALWEAPAFAQSWPQQTVRFIVPFGPAAGADLTARLFADRLSARWGKPVVVENRPGGDGLVAINALIGANDDHTLLFAPTSTFTAHPYTHEKLTYDAERDLLPIANVTTIVLAISASASLNIGSLDQLVALARAQPGKLNAAAAPGNSDLLLFGFFKSAGLQVAKVPYRDIMQAPTDLAEGRIDVLMASFAAMRPQIQAGKVKPLAITSRERASIVPDVPTATEAGYPALELEGLVGLFAPRGMAGDLRERIAEALRATAEADPAIATRLAATGQVVNVRGPAAFAAAIAEQRAKLDAIAKTLGIKRAQ